VIVGLVAEVILALAHLPSESTLSNWGAVAADALVALGVCGEVQFGRMAFRRDKEMKRRSDDKTANSNERAELANQKAQEAMLETEKLRKQLGPRYIDTAVFLRDLDGSPTASVEILYLRDDPDSIGLSRQLMALLHGAGWQISAWKPIPPPTEHPFSELPTTYSVGGGTSGVTIVLAPFKTAVDPMTSLLEGSVATSAYTALGRAILSTLGGVGTKWDPIIPEGSLRVVVAPRN
jgi:hypothetical protein